MPTKPFVSMQNVAKRWNGQLGVEEVSLDIEEGSFVALLGPSGCGKSTSLRLLAGLEMADEGQIFIQGRKKRDKKAALKFMKKAMRRYGSPNEIVTDRLRSYSAAAKELGCADKQVTQRWANNRAENSHVPFRRRERAMLRFRRMHSLQKFASIHASFHNHFNAQRSLSTRSTFKLNRDAALTEWRSLIAS